MQRTATAVWNGSLREGSGNISTQSGVLSSAPYSFATRFENGKGTNPEELIAAAHAGCFTMALDAQLATMHFTPDKLQTTATVTLDKIDTGWAITKVHLDVAASFAASPHRPSKQPQPAPRKIAPSRVCSRPKSR